MKSLEGTVSSIYTIYIDKTNHNYHIAKIIYYMCQQEQTQRAVILSILSIRPLSSTAVM